MKKRTRASQRRLNNLLLILLLFAILLIMSTYAWFTANRTVNIDSISLHVTTSSGLQISANGKDWKTVLDYQDIKDAYKEYTAARNQLPDNLAPTSTVLEEAEGKLKMFFGDINTDLEPTSATYGKYLLTSKLQTDVNTYSSSGNLNDNGEYGSGYYFAFDIFLKDTAGADNLYMQGSIKEDETKVQTVGKGLENAARIALIKGGFTADADTPSSVQALSTVGGDVVMWEPNADAHTDRGIENGESLGWVTPGSLNATGNAPIAYDGVNQEVQNVELSAATNTHASGAFSRVTPTWTTNKDDVVDLQMPSGLEAGATKYRVYMWIEGQDIDCQNYASGTDLIYNLSFSLDSYTATPKAPNT